MARPDTWMPLYWGDFWKDTTHLSEIEGWAYINLIGAYWTQGGPLVNDDVRLQRLSKCAPRNWRSVRATVLAFFKPQGDRLTHGRIDAELAQALKTYAARKARVASLNTSRWGAPEAALMNAMADDTVHGMASGTMDVSVVDTTVDTRTETTIVPQSQSQPHSPDGDTDAVASVPTRRSRTSPSRKSRTRRRTRLGHAWQPTADDRRHAAAAGLTPEEIARDLAEFRDYWNSGEPRDPLRADWSRAYRNHIDLYAGAIVARRALAQRAAARSAQNPRSPQSFTAARDQILAEAGVCGGEHRPLRTDRGLQPGSDLDGADDAGTVIDADDWQRVPDAADGAEGADAADPGRHGRFEGAVQDLSRQADGIPRGRGALCAEDASGEQPVLPGLARAEGTAAHPQLPPADDVIVPGEVRHERGHPPSWR